MDNIQRARRALKNPLQNGHVGKVAFFISMSHVFKRSREEKAHIFYFLTADVDQVVTSVEVEELCKILLDSYVTALKKTSVGAQWKLQTSVEANHRFAKNAVKDLLGKKTDPSCVAPEEFLPWFNKFPLIENLFLAVMRACFLDVESLVEEKPHGLEEGCEETVAHVQYDRLVRAQGHEIFIYLPLMNTQSSVFDVHVKVSGLSAPSTDYHHTLKIHSGIYKLCVS